MRAQGIPDSAARVEFTVQFSHGPKGRRRAHEASGQPDPTHPTGSEAAPPKMTFASRVPKITRLLVLGHHFEQLVRGGVVKDYAEIARLTGLTRARITQIVNLTLLAPDIQEEVLTLYRGALEQQRICERQFRAIASTPTWLEQHRLLA